MNPVLYPANELTRTTGPADRFAGSGIGVLSDSISCTVTEERNGEYELELQYPANGLWSDDIEVGQYIKAKANDRDPDQLFVIYDIFKTLSGAYEIHAHHISYRLSGIAVRPYASRTGAAQALQNINRYAIATPHKPGTADTTTGFVLATDMDSTTSYKIVTPRSARSILGGEEGSLLDVYGGEYHFDNFKIEWLKSRGQDNGVEIRYGKNLTDLQQDINGAVYSGLYPYWYKENEGYVAPADAVYADPDNPDTIQQVEVIDLTDDFDTKPTAAQLTARAEQLVQGMGSPVESLEVSFVTLHQLQEYETIAALEHVSLCDTVHVIYPLLKIDQAAKVVKTVYNSLTEHYETITIGALQTTLADLITEGVISGGGDVVIDDDLYKVVTVTQLSSTTINAGAGKDVGFTAPSSIMIDGGLTYNLVANCPLQINCAGTGSTYVIVSQGRPGGCYLRNAGSGAATVTVTCYYLYQLSRRQFGS